MSCRTREALRPPFVAAGLALGVILATGGGCQSGSGRPAQAAAAEVAPERIDVASAGPALDALSSTEPNSSVEAMVVPPLGWRADPLKSSAKHQHQVWISPSGNTAYGVIHFKMPLPVGADAALRFGILPEMRRTEGEARLVSSRRDRDLPGLRFEAEGGQYHLRSNLITRGRQGWAVYAGTLRAKEIVPDELALAELAREHTAVGLKR
ncbi:MAG: hypothetical protein AVDCRST_MAG64-1188 [uncultured Phycisphaerae bacterium]|uniref:Lipoprotein n=1 Tax=uncultured Phycisphaerae bacterium TaxID=904963 RepID=A0A6J4NKZ1_9BACT|nr:MAG: hypothetical protein AVDCRST_MAG64-1188 [uncultured Phycisphaerae bacterium]